ncbi:hypothetical protein Glove_421g127 [Diversispora epigaea]|uniref:Uncharacterized protein n=1 Tax=Diversispora epigaea TaxID=1348612 RepID=A0A397H3M1_9GLOM|nr:hypothetical protein Glove_421g127 [Diversispora epigaea]
MASEEASSKSRSDLEIVLKRTLCKEENESVIGYKLILDNRYHHRSSPIIEREAYEREQQEREQEAYEQQQIEEEKERERTRREQE